MLNNEREIFEERERHLQNILEIIKKILPEASWGSSFNMYSANTTRVKEVNALLTSGNRLLTKSIYANTAKSRFIHFTSIANLLSILRTYKIRAYDLRNMSGPQELKYPIKALFSVNDKDLEELQSEVFCFSMCDYKIEENEESHIMWQLYGDKGNGVGIVLSFESENIENWTRHNLGNIQYEGETLATVKEVIEKIGLYSEQNNLSINDLPKSFAPILVFHKNRIHFFENEVRFAVNNFDYPKIEIPFIFQDINKRNKATSFFEIDIERDADIKKGQNFIDAINKSNPGMNLTLDYYRSLNPQIKIEKIILGYDIPPNNEICETINAIQKANGRSPIPIECSSLRKYYV